MDVASKSGEQAGPGPGPHRRPFEDSAARSNSATRASMYAPSKATPAAADVCECPSPREHVTGIMFWMPAKSQFDRPLLRCDREIVTPMQAPCQTKREESEDGKVSRQ